MKDRADYARKGIARGRSLVALAYDDGIVIVAENPSHTLRKISEIYDRIAFAGVGKYNEFDQLRVAGVRHADLKGYSYSREDVDARSLANAVRADPRPGLHPRDEAARGRDPRRRGRRRAPATTSCSTSSTTARSWTSSAISVLGGEAEAIVDAVEAGFRDGHGPGRGARARGVGAAGPERTLAADELEVAVLDRSNGRRAFRRIDERRARRLLRARRPATAALGGPGARQVRAPTARTAPPSHRHGVAAEAAGDARSARGRTAPRARPAGAAHAPASCQVELRRRGDAERRQRHDAPARRATVPSGARPAWRPSTAASGRRRSSARRAERPRGPSPGRRLGHVARGPGPWGTGRRCRRAAPTAMPSAPSRAARTCASNGGRPTVSDAGPSDRRPCGDAPAGSA